MALSPREAFKFGFLLRCADEGLGEGAIADRVKTAATLLDGQEKQAGGMADALVNAAKSLGGLATRAGGLGLAGGAALGGLGGHLLAKSTEREVDPEEAKMEELIAAYQQQTERARRAAQRRSYRERKAPRAPSFF